MAAKSEIRNPSLRTPVGAKSEIERQPGPHADLSRSGLEPGARVPTSVKPKIEHTTLSKAAYDLLEAFCGGHFVFEFPGSQLLIRGIPGDGELCVCSTISFRRLKELGFVSRKRSFKAMNNRVIAHQWVVNNFGMFALRNAKQYRSRFAPVDVVASAPEVTK